MQIGNQIWMQENLNYETANSWWYDNLESNGNIYGRLYTWDAANSACPSGWHLPSDDEWKTLELELGMSQNEVDAEGWRGTDEGLKLKSTNGWYNNGNGTNESGFAVIPGGTVYSSEVFSDIYYRSYFWTSTLNGTENAWKRLIDDQHDDVGRDSYNCSLGYSVRCLKN